MKKVYIASPYAGDVDHNVAMAREYCRFAVKQGVIPFAPHLLFTQFLDDAKPEERVLGCQMGKEFLSTCDELWVFGDRISQGMAAEIAEAERLGIRTEYVPAINLKVKNTISIYTGATGERLERLSDSTMLLNKDADIPDSVVRWGESFRDAAASHIFFAELKGQYGVYSVNEYSLGNYKQLFGGDQDSMRTRMITAAAALAETEIMRGIQVYTGLGTGNGGCDEIGVFIPEDIYPDQVLDMLAEIDARANPYRVMEPEREQIISMEMGLT